MLVLLLTLSCVAVFIFKNFKELDINGDNMVSADEIFQVKTEDIVRLLSPVSRPDNEEEENEIESSDDDSENKVKEEL